MKKNQWPMFLVIAIVTNLTGKFTWLHEVFWISLWSYKIMSVTTKMLQKTQIFQKKSTFPMKKNK